MKECRTPNGLASESKVLSSSQFNHQYFPIPPFIPELESLSQPQIEKLNNNTDVLDQFVEELPQAVAVINDVENRMDNVEQLASNNISYWLNWIEMCN